MSTVGSVLFWLTIACFAYLMLVMVLHVFQVLVSLAENAARTREHRSEEYETISASRFTIPVSVILAVHNEEPIVVPAVHAALAQDYPELEVIVVNDGSTDGTLKRLVEEFHLEPRKIFYRHVLETEEVLTTYTSDAEPTLVLVDKANGGKADALNCGLNFARYRYVCGVDGDTVLRKDALLRGMRLALRDPAEVLGVTSHVSITFEPERSTTANGGQRNVDRSLLSNFQHLDYVRSFYNSRLAWTRLGFMLCAVGAFHIWRRDLLLEMGGFSRQFTCEDIELTFRVHERFRREQRPYKILSLPDNVGATEGPRHVRSLVSQRARWQRVIAETVWHYRRMLGNPRYGTVGLLGTPFYLVAEVIAPLFEVLAVVMLPLGIAFGLFDPLDFLLFLGVIAFFSGLLTTSALILDDRSARTYRSERYRKRDLTRLVLLGPADLVLYRPILIWARAKGTWDFLRGERGWHKFERNARGSEAVAS
jgi:poly-beta-1,6-N-acetyl-D-glucosamine synthase